MLSELLLLSSCKEKLTSVFISHQQTEQIDSLYSIASGVIDSDPIQAVALGKTMLSKAEASSYTEGIAKAHRLLGTAYDYSGRYDSAIKHHMADLQIRQAMDDEVGIAKSYNSIAVVHKLIGLQSDAVIYYQRALTILNNTENKSLYASVNYNLGRVYEQLKQFDKAEQSYRHSLSLFKLHRDTLLIGQVTNDLSWLTELRLNANHNASKNDLLRLLNSYHESLKIQQKIGYANSIAWTHIHIGRIYNRLNRPLESIPHLVKAKEILENTDDSANFLIALNEYAEAMYLQHNEKVALELLLRGEKVIKQMHSPAFEAINDTYELFQKIHTGLNNADQVAIYKAKQLQNQKEEKLVEEKGRQHNVDYQVLVKKVESNMYEKAASYEKQRRVYFEIATVCLAVVLLILSYLFSRTSNTLKEHRELSKILLGR